MTNEAPRFLADVMLGTLAKWLRILGYDVSYDNRIDDDQIVDRCEAENRIALTRDRRLIQRRRLRRFVFIRSDHLLEQIREVLDYLGEGVHSERLLTRCVECNALLEPASKEAVRDHVPPFVHETQIRFKRCPSCRKIYWGGTHREHMLEKLRTLLAGESPS